MCKKIVITFCFGMLLFLRIGLDKPCVAQTKVIIAEGEYVMGSGETMEVAEERAKKLAIQNAAEQAGAFVKSYSEVKNFVLESDVVEVVADHSMKVEVIALKKTVLGDVDAIKFYVKIQATVTEEEIEANLKKVREDQSMVDAYNRLKADYEKQNEEMEQLKTQLEHAVGGDRQKIAGLISEEEKKFKANLWVEKAQKSSYFTDDALHAYKKALELNPDLAQAYVGMADVLHFQNMGEPFELNELEKKYEKLKEALAYLENAVSMDENYADAYAMRAGLLEDTRNTDRRINEQKEESKDFTETEKQYDEQILKDINRAIVLNASNKADLYQKRAYFHLDAMQSAELAESSPDVVATYLDKAIADINQAIALCKEGDVERLAGYYFTKARIYGDAKNYYIRKDDAAKEKQYEELASQWSQKAQELAREKEALSEQAEKASEELMQTTEIGKLYYEIEFGWREKVLGPLKDLEGMDEEERNRIRERRTAELKDRIASGAASAEDYLWVAFHPDESVESRRDNYEKGLALLEARNPEGREALLLVQFYIYKAQYHSDEQQSDRALEGLNKAQTVVDRHFPEAQRALSLDEFWQIANQMKSSGNSEKASGLNKVEAESFYWIQFALQIPYLRATVYEKLDLPAKAMEEYRYLCETLKDEEACKAVERLR